MDFKIYLVGQRVALFIDSSIMRQGGNKGGRGRDGRREEKRSKGVREGGREGGEEIERERKREDSIVVSPAGGMCRRVRGRNWQERGR